MDFLKYAVFVASSTCALALAANAHAASGNGVTVTPMGGYYVYDQSFDIDHHEVWGGALGYQTSGAMEYSINYLTGSTVFSGTDFDVDMENVYLTGTYHFQRSMNSHPYILIGGGQQNYEAATGKYEDSIAVAGAGYKIAMGQSFSLRPDVRALYNLDENSTTVGFMLGVSWLIGGKSAAVESKQAIVLDGDTDGVEDGQDRCPNTAAGTSVDIYGCDVNMDSDFDGVPDQMDKCPDTSESAKVDEKGCYILITEAKEIQLYVTFQGGSSVLTADAYSQLRNVADFMAEYPLTRVVLAGHTDSTGSANFNQSLSLQRAQSVSRFLTQNFGIEPSRIETVGYGESQPLFSNDTPENRAANRRVTATVTAMVEARKQ